jgi:ABC-type Fe3+-hydroxamate transport system substrate-binding protein
MKLTDQTGHYIELNQTPSRIVSLVPSQTELLYHLRLEDKIVGITKFCVHPAHWYKNKVHVGGTKKLNHQKIAALKPDLIIANKEENSQSDIELLQTQYPVYISNIRNLSEALHMIAQLGILTQTEMNATNLIRKIEQAFASIPSKKKHKALYLIWKNPYMAAGKDTFINDMMNYAGYFNCIEKNRYPTLTLTEIIRLQPEYILLSSEPYPFKYKHQEELKKILPHTKILLVDGEMFSWYGSRLLKAAEYFTKNLPASEPA